MKSVRDIFKSSMSAEQLAKKHHVDIDAIKKALKQGTKVEHEHTRIRKIAQKIASHHVAEDPNYYNKLSKMEKNIHENIGLRLGLRYLVNKKVRKMQKDVDPAIIQAKRDLAKKNRQAAAAVLGGALGSIAGTVATANPAGTMTGMAVGAALGKRLMREQKYPKTKEEWEKWSLRQAIKDNVAHGKANKRFKEKIKQVNEKLDPSMGAGQYVKDFRKSKAPQFKGKSDKKKQQMAIAAYLEARRKK